MGNLAKVNPACRQYPSVATWFTADRWQPGTGTDRLPAEARRCRLAEMKCSVDDRRDVDRYVALTDL